MAASGASQGYQCEFLDSVPDDFYCKQCSLVARRLTITSCCGESYCNACIHSTQQNSKPCPGCGTQDFQFFQQVKYQKKILSLKVYCSAKDQGCEWCAPLEQLLAHVDPHTGDCQYTDTHCPLKCDKMVNKTKLSAHMTYECVKRSYACPYCALKGPYDVVTTSHLSDCSNYPVTCPNEGCGESCERWAMEEHVRTCSLQEVECDYKQIGCKDMFKMAEREDHMQSKTQAHLRLMMAVSVGMYTDLHRKFQEQQAYFQDVLAVQRRDFEEQTQARLRDQAGKLEHLRGAVSRLERAMGLRHTFAMHSFSVEKAKDRYDDWKTPPMYTHLCGYKFCIGVDANGCVQTRGESVNVELWVMKGEYDDRLKWPVAARFTLELRNHFEGGENKRVVQTITWRQPDKKFDRIVGFRADGGGSGGGKRYHFIKHSELPYNPATRTHFLKDDALHFEITDITLI